MGETTLVVLHSSGSVLQGIVNALLDAIMDNCKATYNFVVVVLEEVE